MCTINSKNNLEDHNNLYKNLTPFLNCIDYTVSKESFEVMYNKDLDMLVTSPIPKDLHNYYKSDDYISHTDNKKSVVEKLYYIIKKYTIYNKVKLINSFNFERKNILDIGAGTGDFLKVCKQNGWNVRGIETSKRAIRLAKQKGINLENNLNKIIDKKYDIITLWHVLEHVTNLYEYIHKIKSLLDDNGVLIIAVPNYKSYDSKFYKEFWAGYDVPRHVWHFSENSINKIFGKYKMKIEKIIPMKFDSFYVSILSEKYKNGKNNFLRAFYIGLKSNIRAKRKNNYSSLIYLIKKTKN